jgi:hypothetical protein
MDDALEMMAARQHGLITRSQARRAKLSDEAIRHRVANGRWIRVRPGLYALVGAEPTWEQQVHGTVLMVSGEAWASHGTSARLWGYDGYSEWPIEITVPLGANARVAGVRTHRSGTLEHGDLREVDGSRRSRRLGLLLTCRRASIPSGLPASSTTGSGAV